MNETNDLFAKATAGVYAEIMNQIYDSLDKRIREAVSNSFDAHAKNIRISVFKHHSEPDKIIIRDDGDGMDKDDIRDKYICMGGGDNYNNKFTIGRIGIGALSIFALGDKITVSSRKKGSDRIITAKLNFTKLKNPEEHAVPLDQVKLGSIVREDTASDSDDEHFTEIIVEDLSGAARTLFANNNTTQELISALERILPIPYRSDDALFTHISSDLQEAISASKYLIDVTLHVPHLEINNYKLFRRSMYSDNKTSIERIIPIYPFKNFIHAADSNLCVYGYLYVNKGEKLPKEWQGINARVKNVTIEKNTYFGYQEDPASLVRIGGELFIDNIEENKAIQSNRSGFTIENQDYRSIAEYMTQWIVEKAVAAVRKSSKIDTEVKRIIKPLESIRAMCDRISKIENDKSCANDFQSLTDKNCDMIGREIKQFSLEQKLKSKLQDLFSVDPDVIWSSVIEKPYHIEFDDDDYYTIQVQESLRKFVHDVAGNTIEFIPCHCGQDMPAVIKNDSRILLNLDNKLMPGIDITKLDVGLLEVIIVLYLNYLRCDGSAKDLYNKAIDDLSFL